MNWLVSLLIKYREKQIGTPSQIKHMKKEIEKSEKNSDKVYLEIMEMSVKYFEMRTLYLDNEADKLKANRLVIAGQLLIDSIRCRFRL